MKGVSFHTRAGVTRRGTEQWQLQFKVRTEKEVRLREATRSWVGLLPGSAPPNA